MTAAGPFHKRLFGVYGAGGCGRGIMPIARDMLIGQFDPNEYELVFIDDHESSPVVNNHRVVSFDEFVDTKAPSHAVSLAVADCSVRRRLAERCQDHLVDTFAIAAPSVVIMDSVDLGAGAILSPFVTLTSNISIGRHFQANLYSYVEHDCIIGDFVTFAPSVHCNGNVVIEDGAYLGTGCILRQGKPEAPLVIGRGAFVGMGAVVTKDVPPGATVVGNPARPLQND